MVASSRTVLYSYCCCPGRVSRVTSTNFQLFVFADLFLSISCISHGKLMAKSICVELNWIELNWIELKQNMLRPREPHLIWPASHTLPILGLDYSNYRTDGMGWRPRWLCTAGSHWLQPLRNVSRISNHWTLNKRAEEGSQTGRLQQVKQTIIQNEQVIICHVFLRTGLWYKPHDAWSFNYQKN